MVRVPLLHGGGRRFKSCHSDMEKDIWIKEDFYQREVAKWKTLALSAMQERSKLKIQNEELRAEVQRLQNIAVY